MPHISILGCGALLALLLLALACPAPAQTLAPLEREGAFTLFKFSKPIGREHYTVAAGARRLELHSSFLFTDRGTPVPLETTFTATADLEPQSLVTNGSSSRVSELHDALELHGTAVRLVRDGHRSDLPLPPGAFLIDGYSPVVMQQLLLRFWLTHGRPAAIPILPSGSRVQIHVAGPLVLSNGQTLTGYTVSGLIWGQESVWLSSSGALVALIGTDAELDHFEAVREGYEAQLPRFIAEAATAELANLAALTTSIGPEEHSGPPAAPQSAAAPLAITGATLIDGRGGPPLPNAVVLLEGGRIRAAGPAASVGVPPGTATLDARGKWLLPGLWDMHAHVEQVEWGPIYLASGITTVRDCGNELPFLTAVRDTIAAGRGIGPRILIAGLVDGTGPQSLGAVTADTPDQARAVVARYHAAGALQIKLYSSIRPSLVPVFAAEAHRLGMTVTGHVPTGMSASEAVLAGMDQISHVQYPAAEFRSRNGLPPDAAIPFNSPSSRALLALYKAHGTVFDPTLAIYELELHSASVPLASLEPGIIHVAPELRPSLESIGVGPEDAPAAALHLRNLLATVAALHRAGLPVVAGTDQVVPGYSLHRELELYVQAGFTPMESIATATRVPAEVMGLAAELGTVEPGKRADLVLLDADPLADIRATRQVWRTVSGGTVYAPAPLWRSVGFTP